MKISSSFPYSAIRFRGNPSSPMDKLAQLRQELQTKLDAEALAIKPASSQAAKPKGFFAKLGSYLNPKTAIAALALGASAPAAITTYDMMSDKTIVVQGEVVYSGTGVMDPTGNLTLQSTGPTMLQTASSENTEVISNEEARRLIAMEKEAANKDKTAWLIKVSEQEFGLLNFQTEAILSAYEGYPEYNRDVFNGFLDYQDYQSAIHWQGSDFRIQQQVEKALHKAYFEMGVVDSKGDVNQDRLAFLVDTHNLLPETEQLAYQEERVWQEKEKFYLLHGTAERVLLDKQWKLPALIVHHQGLPQGAEWDFWGFLDELGTDYHVDWNAPNATLIPQLKSALTQVFTEMGAIDAQGQVNHERIDQIYNESLGP